MRRVGKAKRAHHLYACDLGDVRLGNGEAAVAHPTQALGVQPLRRHRRGRRLLVLLALIENTARLDHASVGVDVGLRRIGNDQQIALLPCSTD
jgi:hypothetical protein